MERQNYIYVLEDCDGKFYYLSTFDKVKSVLYNLIEDKKKNCDCYTAVEVLNEQQALIQAADDPIQIANITHKLYDVSKAKVQ